MIDSAQQLSTQKAAWCSSVVLQGGTAILGMICEGIVAGSVLLARLPTGCQVQWLRKTLWGHTQHLAGQCAMVGLRLRTWWKSLNWLVFEWNATQAANWSRQGTWKEMGLSVLKKIMSQVTLGGAGATGKVWEIG